MNRDSRTLLLGLGNPLLRDDGVGPALAARTHALLGDRFDLRQEAVVGLELIDALSGYERVVIVDAIFSPDCEVGALYRLRLHDTPVALPDAAHAFGLLETLELMRRLTLPTPRCTVVFAVGVADPCTFAAGLTADLETRMPSLAHRLARRLQRWTGAGRRLAPTDSAVPGPVGVG